MLRKGWRSRRGARGSSVCWFMPSRVGGFVQVYLSVYVHFLVFSVLFMMHSFFVLVSFVSFVMFCRSLSVYGSFLLLARCF